MSILLSPKNIGPMTIKNRFMRSPIYVPARDQDGSANNVLLQIIERLSNGEVGLIIPKYTYTPDDDDNDKLFPIKKAVSNRIRAKSWISTIQKVHNNGSKLVFRICHPGIDAVPNIDKGPDHTLDLTQVEIEDIIESFQKLALKAKRLGADGVEINESKDHIFSKFLSPIRNQRNDKYGGSLENRARVISETANAIRNVTGPDFSVLVKMNGNTLLKYGTSLELASRYINVIKKNVDMFEISCEIPNIKINAKENDEKQCLKRIYCGILSESFNLSYAEFIKQNNPDTAVASVGKFDTISLMEDAVANKHIDLISLSKPIMKEPELIQKLKKTTV